MEENCEHCINIMLELDIMWNKIDAKIAMLYDNQKFIMEVLEQFKSKDNGFDISTITRQ